MVQNSIICGKKAIREFLGTSCALFARGPEKAYRNEGNAHTASGSAAGRESA